MKNIVIGTAGHIDHGKTTLTKNLTGVDTDTLPEEKERGMTINLGFTYMNLENGEKVGLIDVPGHEKFIKNMVAGTNGIDYMMLVVAADDGVMPQTKEHLNIIKLLGITDGIVVITKTDTVNLKRVEEVKSEIRKEFKGSFVDTCKILTVNNKDKDSYIKLKRVLNDEIKNIKEKITENVNDRFRMSVDRVFSVKGFGTVVTGTTIGGIIAEGDNIVLYPSKKVTRVRGIQNHGESVKSLPGGNRCALNLSDLDVGDIKRGDVLAHQNTLEISSRIDVEFTLLEDKKPLKNNQRIRLHLGTSEKIGRVRLFGVDELEPKDTAFAQLVLEEEVSGALRDIGIIRNYTPLDTIGSIEILNMAGKKVKRKDKEYIEFLKDITNERLDIKVEKWIDKNNKEILNINEIELGTGLPKEKLISVIDDLVSCGKLIRLEAMKPFVYSHMNYINALKSRVLEYLTSYHKSNPLKSGANISEVREQCFSKNLNIKNVGELFDLFMDEKLIKVDENFVSLIDFKVRLTKSQKKIKDIILIKYKENQFKPPKYSELEDLVDDLDELLKIHSLLITTGLLISLDSDICFMKGFFNEGKQRILEGAVDGKITLSETRELLGTSRKYALAFLEKLDSLGITKRIDDYRIILKK